LSENEQSVAKAWLQREQIRPTWGVFHNEDDDPVDNVFAAFLRLDGEQRARLDEGGGFKITLDRHTLDRLRALRGPGESYSDVILRLAAEQR
jgi:hypothetical protein